MATETWLIPVVTAIMGGGVVSGLSQLWAARNTSRQVKIQEERAPADVNTVILGGASQAVDVLTNSLKWAQDELQGIRIEQANDKQCIRDLIASNDSKDARIGELERELATLRVKLQEVQTALDNALARINEMHSRES